MTSASGSGPSSGATRIPTSSRRRNTGRRQPDSSGAPPKLPLGLGPVDRLAEHESMTVRRAKAELTHSPRLVPWRLQNLSTLSDCPPVERINVLDTEIGNITVIAKLTGSRIVRASPQHERDGSRTTEPPIPRVNIVDPAPQDVAIPRTGSTQVVDRENGIRAGDPHSGILPQARPTGLHDSTRSAPARTNGCSVEYRWPTDAGASCLAGRNRNGVDSMTSSSGRRFTRGIIASPHRDGTMRSWPRYVRRSQSTRTS